MHNVLMRSKPLLHPKGRSRGPFAFMPNLLMVAGVLVIPLSLLLFAQWPLREWVQVGSRQANDVAQMLFAVYMAVAITAASRAHTHLAAETSSAQGLAPPASLWRTGLMLVCLGPWALFTLWAAKDQILFSLQGLEQFAETQTPGFFVIKLALGVLLVLVLVEALVSCWTAWRHRGA